jgi:hypothetical protein
LVLALPLAGCGKLGSAKIAPISGRVTLDNKPLPDALVTFVPKSADPDATDALSSIGTTDEDGRYTLVTTKDTNTNGAVVGKHRVIIMLGAGKTKDTKPTFHKQLPAKYNRNSVLEYDVPAEGREDANFDLSSK